MKGMKLRVASMCLLGTIAPPFTYGQAPMALQDPATGKPVMADASGQRIDLDFVRDVE